MRCLAGPDCLAVWAQEMGELEHHPLQVKDLFLLLQMVLQNQYLRRRQGLDLGQTGLVRHWCLFLEDGLKM